MNRIDVLVISLLFIIIVLFPGCLNDENEIHFSIYYSSSPIENEQFNLTITTNNIEVFNETVIPQSGELIY